MKLIMIGAPGAGKGTQAERIAEKYNIPHVSTGDIFRANLKGGTELGMKAKVYMDKGELVPDDITIGMLMDRIAQADCANGYVLDGFPRTIPQAEALEKALAAKGEAIDYVIDCDVPDVVIIDRMGGRRSCPNCGAGYHTVFHAPQAEGICDKCQSKLILREDDKPETVKHRLEVYHDQTQPLVDFYGARNILKTVDGTQDMEKVFDDITVILG